MVTNEIPAHLRWACRRGMLELDVILGNFLEEQYLKVSPSEQAIFAQILDSEDQNLYQWLTGSVMTPIPEWAVLIEKIRSHAKNRH